jgi:hypothetical protein
MSAWPGRSLNITRDNANYSCVSSNNDVGMGTRTVTSLGVECETSLFFDILFQF